MGAAQLFSARDSANDFTCNVAGTDGLCNSVARGSSSIARFDPVSRDTHRGFAGRTDRWMGAVVVVGVFSRPPPACSHLSTQCAY